MALRRLDPRDKWLGLKELFPAPHGCRNQRMEERLAELEMELTDSLNDGHCMVGRRGGRVGTEREEKEREQERQWSHYRWVNCNSVIHSRPGIECSGDCLGTRVCSVRDHNLFTDHNVFRDYGLFNDHRVLDHYYLFIITTLASKCWDFERHFKGLVIKCLNACIHMHRHAYMHTYRSAHMYWSHYSNSGWFIQLCKRSLNEGIQGI